MAGEEGFGEVGFEAGDAGVEEAVDRETNSL